MSREGPEALRNRKAPMTTAAGVKYSFLSEDGIWKVKKKGVLEEYEKKTADCSQLVQEKGVDTPTLVSTKAKGEVGQKATHPPEGRNRLATSPR